jgi:DNA-binding response OmpR family regulator
MCLAMDPRERAWTELGVIERFVATDQPREALARARHLEASLAGSPELAELHAFVVIRREQLEDAVARWDEAVQKRHDVFVAHERRKKR